MAADLALLDEVAAGRAAGAAALPLVAAGAVARALPARHRRRRAPRARGWASRSCAGRPAGGRCSTAATSPTRSRSRGPPAPRARSTRSTSASPGALIAGLARLGVDGGDRPHDGPSGPVCFAGQQGADLRVGDRKLCGSAQVQRRGRGPPARLDPARPAARSTRSTCSSPGPDAPAVTRDALRAATVTLDELGAPDRPARGRRRAGRRVRAHPRPHVRPRASTSTRGRGSVRPHVEGRTDGPPAG